MNRETKRLLKRQGQLAEDGSYAPPAPSQTNVQPKITKSETFKKKGLFVAIITFFQEVVAELKKVSWPTQTEVINYSILVFVTLLVVALLVFGIDYGATKAVLYLFQK